MRIKSNSSAILQAGTTYGKYTRPPFIKNHEDAISAQNGWGVTSPSEKKWIEQQLAKPRGEDLGALSAERVQGLEKQLKTLMFVRQEKIQLGKRIAQQRSHIRELQNKFDAAQIRIRQMETRIQQLEEERHYSL